MKFIISLFLLVCICSCLAKDLVVGTSYSNRLVWRIKANHMPFPFRKRVQEYFYANPDQQLIRVSGCNIYLLIVKTMVISSVISPRGTLSAHTIASIEVLYILHTLLIWGHIVLHAVTRGRIHHLFLASSHTVSQKIAIVVTIAIASYTKSSID